MGLQPHLGTNPLHIGALTSLLVPWSDLSFPARDHVGLPLPSLPTKVTRTRSPAADEILFFPDFSKTGRKADAAFAHRHPPDSTVGPHLSRPPVACVYPTQNSPPTAARSNMPHLSPLTLT